MLFNAKWMVKMRHAFGIWNVNPAFHQGRIRFTIGVLYNPVFEPKLTNVISVQHASTIVVPVKANVGLDCRIVVGENACFAT